LFGLQCRDAAGVHGRKILRLDSRNLGCRQHHHLLRDYRSELLCDQRGDLRSIDGHYLRCLQSRETAGIERANIQSLQGYKLRRS
jgi:hypothetical protein